MYYGGKTNVRGKEESNEKEKQEGGIYGSTEGNGTPQFTEIDLGEAGSVVVKWADDI